MNHAPYTTSARAGILDQEANKMNLVKELWGFLKIRKKFWLAPILMVLVILSAFIGLATTSPVWAPFIYPFF
jgi:hypothetical protein